jgi:hypothetical protein
MPEFDSPKRWQDADPLAPSELDTAPTRDPVDVLRHVHNLVMDCTLGVFGDTEEFPQELKQFVQVQLTHFPMLVDIKLLRMHCFHSDRCGQKTFMAQIR